MTNTAKKLNVMTSLDLPVRFFDAGVDHLNEDLVKLLKRDHQLLLLLHHSETVFGHNHRVVEKEVVFTGQLNHDVFSLVNTVASLQGHFSIDLLFQGREF